MENNILPRILALACFFLATACDLSNAPSEEFGKERTFVKLYGGEDNYMGMEGYPLAEGGYILSGNSHITLPSGIYSPQQTLEGFMHLIKTDELGNELWSATPDTSSFNIATCMAIDADGNYALAGSSVPLEGASLPNADVRVMRVGRNGELLWLRDYGDVVRQGGDIATDIQVASNGDYLIIGYTTGVRGTSTNLVTNTDIYALRVDASDGSVIWERTYGLQGQLADRGAAIKEDRDGNLVWLGSAEAGPNTSFMRLIKSNAAGDILWDFSYELNGGNQEPGDLLITPAGYTVLGSTGNFFALFRTNSGGQLLWQKVFSELNGARPLPSSLSLSSDGFLLLSGAYWLGGDNYDQLLVKAKAGNGELVWHQTYGEGNQDIGRQATGMADGSILINGTMGFGSNSLISLIKTDLEGKLSD